MLLILGGVNGCGTKRATTRTDPAPVEEKEGTPGLDLVADNCAGPRAVDIGEILIDLHFDNLDLKSQVDQLKDKNDIKDEKASQEVGQWKVYTIVGTCVGVVVGLLTGVLAF